MDLEHETCFRKNPWERANIFSKLTFSWLLPLFCKGRKKTLTPQDLFQIPRQYEADQLGRQLEIAWEEECRNSKNSKRTPKLYRPLLKLYWRQFSVIFFLLMLDEWIFGITQSIFLFKLTNSFSENSTTKTAQYLYAAGLTFSSLTYAGLFQKFSHELVKIGTKWRIATSSLIYQKSLKLSKASKAGTSTGHVINLLANDVNRFEVNLIYVPYIVLGPGQLIIFMYILWTMTQAGWPSLTGTSVMALLAIFQYFSGKKLTQIQLKISTRTDARSQLMYEIIKAIRVIKIYAWEKPFSHLIATLRRLEINSIKMAAYLRAFNMSMTNSLTNVASAITIIFLVVHGVELKAATVFFIIGIHNTLGGALVFSLPVGVTDFGELFVAMKRIESFLLSSDKEQVVNDRKSMSKSQNDGENHLKSPAIIMDGACARWSGATKSTLENLFVNLSGDKIVMIVGPVGGGKSSFLQALISELPLYKGKSFIEGQVSYASQDSWIFGGNIRQNILFGGHLDPFRYHKILTATSLAQDLNQFPYNDKSLVGENGVILSGGQKARLNLARALYQQADIYLLDDPLSAVDPPVARHIYDRCIAQFLKGKLRILVTHQLQFLSQSHHVIVINQGQIIAQGKYQELVEQGFDFVGLIANQASPQAKTETEKVAKMSIPRDESKKDGTPMALSEKVLSGRMSWRIYWKYFKFGGSIPTLIFILFLFIFSQIVTSFGDYWLSYWTRKIASHHKECQADSEWYQIEGSDHCSGTFDNKMYLGVYVGLVLACFVGAQWRVFYFFKYCLQSSVNIHHEMFQSLIRVPTKFFDQNSAGRILNRFTKDICAIDEPMVMALCASLIMIVALGSTLVVIIVTNYFIIPLAIIFVIIVIYIQQFYACSIREVKRIEAMYRSPILTHFVTTLEGLATIRTMGRQNILISQFHQIQNTHTAAWFIFTEASRAFTYWMDLLTLLFAAAVTFSFLPLSDYFGSSHVGLAISSALGLQGALQSGIRQFTETENFMTSTERILEYSKLESEASLESSRDLKPSSDWPSSGSIKFSHVSLSYTDDLDILKDLTFEIQPKEKIGIVGRTGAGKSSIIAALFRMTEPRGSIYIDGVRVNDIGLHDLRRSISVIPQDPILFSGPLRYNLDPFNQYSDDKLWEVIQEVDLADKVSGLDFLVADRGQNLSVGQRQLVCLARAILRQNQILVMDEATANVDGETSNLIGRTIKTKFANCTIITIAHRLQSVLDSDKILVLDNGRVQEYDNPSILLQNPNGMLTSMMNQTNQH